MKKAFLLVFAILAFTALACGFNVSTANIASAKMAKDPDGNSPTTTFAQNDVFYAVVELANAPDDTKVKAVWSVVEAEGVDSNTTIDEAELTSGSGSLQFNLTNDKLWPAGKYKVDLFLNDKADRTLEFTVEGDSAAAAEPTPEAPTPEEPTPEEPTPEPTAAPAARIASVQLAKDADGKEPTTTFGPDDVFNAIVELVDAPEGTKVKAVWSVIEAEGVDPNQMIDEAELTSGTNTLYFDLTGNQAWPPGQYKVDLYLNGDLDQTVEFSVESDASSAVATPTRQGSAGDTLGGKKEMDVTPEAAGAEPLPLKDDTYTHPSGAFSFGVPEGWDSYSEDEASAAFGDDQSRFGVVFVNTDAAYSAKEFKDFIKKSLDIIVDTFADSYDITTENDKLKENNLYYVGVSFSDGDGNADFFFEQYDRTIFIFYFTSLAYADMLPTRDAILDTYQIDVDAALAAEPTATPTPVPVPPTPKPAAANPFKPPAGVARVFMQNEYGNEYNIDFGDGAGSIQVMPGAQNFYHDVPPGKYRPGLSLPGAGAANIEFEIQADQSYLIIVTNDARIKAGQVYP
ncbi:MAG: hypothetical protein FOGNACKC_05665 [Anaerolineae bacterium]|nr:hypothetical protein [Anaerolineae bacterium]